MDSAGATAGADPTNARGDVPRTAAPRLSIKQIVASALAAVSTTVLLSTFGIAGTIIGAGVASVLTVVANYLYTRSIERTQEKLLPVVAQVLPNAAGAPAGKDRPRGRGDATPPAVDPGAPDPGPAAETAPRNAWLRLIDRYGKVRVLGASAAALFVVVMGTVLAFELTVGKPLAATVTGHEGSGTSISGEVSSSSSPSSGTTGDQPGDTPSDAPSDTPSDDQDSGSGTSSDQPTDSPTTGPTLESGTGDELGDQGGVDGGGQGTTDGGGQGTTDHAPEGTTGGDGSDTTSSRSTDSTTTTRTSTSADTAPSDRGTGSAAKQSRAVGADDPAEAAVEPADS